MVILIWKCVQRVPGLVSGRSRGQPALQGGGRLRHPEGGVPAALPRVPLPHHAAAAPQSGLLPRFRNDSVNLQFPLQRYALPLNIGGAGGVHLQRRNSQHLHELHG